MHHRPNTTPTQSVADAFNVAYNHFNASLFNNHLPTCIIHMHRKAKCYGYFAGGRFGCTADSSKVDEIALNPSHFQKRSVEQSLSTLVHEMVHLWQHHNGKLSKPGYHNKEWAEMMIDVGLYPSSTGAPGGKQTGQSVSHYIISGGDFQNACAELVATGYTLPYIELWDTAKSKSKAASKTKYTCLNCEANAWAKPDTSLVCGTCRQQMEAAS